MKKIVALISIVAIAFLFVGCVQPPAARFNLDFIVDGEVYSATTTDRTVIKTPADPEKDGYEFDGWFWDKDVWEKPLTPSSLKDAPPSEAWLVYAKFVEIENTVFSPRLYSLRDAYALGILSVEDLCDASFYNNGSWNGAAGKDYKKGDTPPRPLAFLSEETENKIRQTFLDEYNLNNDSGVYYSVDDVEISNYCGTYNGAVVVYLEGLYKHTPTLWSENVAGVTFHYGNWNHLRVWVEEKNHEANEQENSSLRIGDFLTLRRAYEIGLLEKTDLENIVYNRYSNGLSCTNGGGDPIEGAPDRFTEIQEIVIEGWTRYLTENHNYTGTSDGISLREFCGVYRGLAAVMMSDPCLSYGEATWTDTVGGVEFSYNDGQSLSVCVVDTSALLWNNESDQPIVNYEFFELEKNEHFLTYHAGWVFTVESNPYTVYRMRPDKSDKQQLPLQTGMLNSFYHNGWIYYNYDVQPYGDEYIVGNMTLCRMRLDGSEITELASAIGDYVVYREWIYFISGLNLYRMKTNGSDCMLVAENCDSFIIEGDYIFLTNIYYENKWIIEGNIIRYNLDGSSKTIILEGTQDDTNRASDYITFVFAHDGYLYYKMTGRQLYRIKFDGSGSEVIINPANGYWIDVAFKDGVIYYLCLDDSISAIYSVGTDGTGTAKLSDIIRPSGISLTLIRDGFYYTTTTDLGLPFKMTLHRLSLNGEHSIVYERGLENNYGGVFAHEDTLYLIIAI